jgi:hypothetical protein
MAKKSRPEQKRAKSQASAGGCAPSPDDRQAQLERIDGEGGVDVQVAEQDLMGAALGHRLLARPAIVNGDARQRGGMDAARPLRVSTTQRQVEKHRRPDYHEDEHGQDDVPRPH